MRSREFLSAPLFIRLAEDPVMKKQIIDVIKSTDDTQVLTKVLKILKAGNIEQRITTVLGKDADASQFLTKIARTIMEIDAPIEEKDAFLKKIESGQAIDTGKLLDGDLHAFADVVGSGFSLALFKQLSVELVSQGVGPGEVALAVLSPNIAWSGRVKGGGDIIVNKKAVEVKTRAASGGRWINARKAGLDLPSIARAIQHALKKSGGSEELSDYIGLDNWVNTIRPQIKDQSLLTKTAKAIADGTFAHVDNAAYHKALISGNENDIKFAIVKVGYDNYKKYSGFAGMLLMDIPTEQVQYFVDFESMVGNISVGTPYILSPETTMMPQVILAPGATIRAGRFNINAEKELAGSTPEELQTAAIDLANKLGAERGIKDDVMINTIATEIMHELQQQTPPTKIVTDLVKKFPQLALRKRAPAPQQPKPAAQPTSPAPVPQTTPTPTAPAAPTTPQTPGRTPR